METDSSGKSATTKVSIGQFLHNTGNDSHQYHHRQIRKSEYMARFFWVYQFGER